MVIPGPLAPPGWSRPNLNMTALSYSCTTCLQKKVMNHKKFFYPDHDDDDRLKHLNTGEEAEGKRGKDEEEGEASEDQGRQAGAVWVVWWLWLLIFWLSFSDHDDDDDVKRGLKSIMMMMMAVCMLLMESFDNSAKRNIFYECKMLSLKTFTPRFQTEMFSRLKCFPAMFTLRPAPPKTFLQTWSSENVCCSLLRIISLKTWPFWAKFSQQENKHLLAWRSQHFHTFFLRSRKVFCIGDKMSKGVSDEQVWRCQIFW